MAEPTLHLRPGRERSVRRQHPWIFSGAVARVTGDPSAGDTVLVRSSDGEALARAAFSPRSQILGRVWTFDVGDVVDDALITGRIERAVAARAALARRTDGIRLVASEADGLPGLTVDRYADVVVCQLLSAGVERWREALVEALGRLPGVATVYERSDVDVRAKEGLPERTGLLLGAEPPDEVVFHESPAAGTTWRFGVDVRHGHKTGFYLDQRDSRRVLAGLARGRVLNTFAYTGAFSVAAASAGAEVVSVDSSGPALALAGRQMQRNGLPPGQMVEADVFADLRERKACGERFDVVVLDPPKLAHREDQVQRATRAYKDLNLQALHLLEPGGHLLTFSRSGLVSDELFQKVVFGAALDARRDAVIEQRLTQATDHPVPLTVPEAWYLKGLVLRVQ